MLEWIKITCDLPEKWQTLSIRRAIKAKTVDEVVGKLFRLWRHFENQSKFGTIQGITADDIDRIVGKSGFANAVAAVGWLTLDPNGGASIPKFDEYMGAASRRRDADAERKRSTPGTGTSAETVRNESGNGAESERNPSGTSAETVRNESGVSTASEIEIDTEVREDISGSPKAATAEESIQPPPEKTRAPDKPKKPRPRNEWFDAIAELSGADPEQAGGRIAKLAHAIKGAGISPAELKARLPAVVAKYAPFRKTLDIATIEACWNWIRVPPATTGPPPNGFRTKGQALDDYFTEQAAACFDQPPNGDHHEPGSRSGSKALPEHG